ncbi:DNA adenine methylase [Dyella lutea]|uniref:DNA adenine methylase n=1 Tax=Dyella lutea TaxID=2950441 RepID=A0ABT1FDE9_9GAMM|nr:DNA adenine methylase [Dyella lutea]MCP1375405.1 DNA adenine methylase [Dyella lutea]
MALPIIPWLGGKRRLADRIFKFFDNTHTCYVEPFCGGAALFFLKPPTDVEVINDINGELINLYRVVSSRKVFEWLKVTRPETLTDIQRAARFYYLQQSAFGGKIEGQTYGTATTAPPGLNLLRLEETLSAAHLRLANAYIEHLPWRDCVGKYDRQHTLFFMDPPYWETEGYGVDFGWPEYQALASTLGTIKGRAILTLNDHPAIRELFSAFHIERAEHTYTVGGGDRAKEVGEVLIFSWDVQREPAGLF